MRFNELSPIWQTEAKKQLLERYIAMDKENAKDMGYEPMSVHLLMEIVEEVKESWDFKIEKNKLTGNLELDYNPIL